MQKAFNELSWSFDLCFFFLIYSWLIWHNVPETHNASVPFDPALETSTAQSAEILHCI